MGQKVNPIGLRLGITDTWSSQWYAKGKEYVANLHRDLEIRKKMSPLVRSAGMSKLKIEYASKMNVTIESSRPAIIISKKGEGIEKIRAEIAKIAGCEVSVNVVENRRPEISAVLVADSIAQQIEKRISFRKVLKRAVSSAMKMGAEGIKVMISGRLGGAEIARSEKASEGRVPLHTLRADISYAEARANTTYGVIGVKVWIYKGQHYNKERW